MMFAFNETFLMTGRCWMEKWDIKTKFQLHYEVWKYAEILANVSGIKTVIKPSGNRHI